MAKDNAIPESGNSPENGRDIRLNHGELPEDHAQQRETDVTSKPHSVESGTRMPEGTPINDPLPVVAPNAGDQAGYASDIGSPEKRLTDYKPTVDECKMLAEQWVARIVSSECAIEFAAYSGGDFRRRDYAFFRLQCILDLGIVTTGELNHLLYVERKRHNLAYDDCDNFGDGIIEHPKTWLQMLATMKHRKANNLGIPYYWEPFMSDDLDRADIQTDDPFAIFMNGGQ